MKFEACVLFIVAGCVIAFIVSACVEGTHSPPIGDRPGMKFRRGQVVRMKIDGRRVMVVRNDYWSSAPYQVRVTSKEGAAGQPYQMLYCAEVELEEWSKADE